MLKCQEMKQICRIKPMNNTERSGKMASHFTKIPIHFGKKNKFSSPFLLLLMVVIPLLFFYSPVSAHQASKIYDYPPSGWQLMYNDPLKTNNGDWQENAFCKFTGDAYQVTVLANKFLNNLPGCKNKKDFKDFAFEIDANSGNADAIMIGVRDDEGDCYQWNIETAGKYIFRSYLARGITLPGSSTLSEGPLSGFHVGRDQSNRLAIVARGNIFNLYVNGKLIDEVTDNSNTSSHGNIFLNVSPSVLDLSQEVTGSFTNMKVWTP